MRDRGRGPTQASIAPKATVAVSQGARDAAHLDLWHSPGGVENAIGVRVAFADVLFAMSELDRYGHRLMMRVMGAAFADITDFEVGLALLRRSVTIFTGLRTLVEASL